MANIREGDRGATDTLQPVHPGAGAIAIARIAPSEAKGLTLSSATLLEGGRIPVECTADGEERSPELAWGALPAGTREVVVLCEDATTQPGPLVHWVVYGIGPDATQIVENIERGEQPARLDGGCQGTNSAGVVGYSGPRPPKEEGVHDYHFQVFALDAPLGLAPGAEANEVVEKMHDHVLAFGEIIGWYGRQ